MLQFAFQCFLILPMHSVFIVTNLGSPCAPTYDAVKAYLREFLMDSHVIDLPWLARFLLVNGLILPFRCTNSTEAYKSIWKESIQLSPLVNHTKSLVENLNQLTSNTSTYYMGMRYGEPSFQNVIKQVITEHPATTTIYLLPLYPHFTQSTYLSSVKHMHQQLEKNMSKSTLQVLKPYYSESTFIQLLCDSIQQHKQHTPYDHLLFSYHSIPVRHIMRMDSTKSHCMKKENCCHINNSSSHKTCYKHQTIATTSSIVHQLNLKESEYSISYQSKVGKDRWLTPSTESTIKKLALQGITRLAVVCPGFSADNLETLEEIAIRGKEIFLHHGGKELTLIPCLNDNAHWAALCSTWTKNPDKYFIDYNSFREHYA